MYDFALYENVTTGINHQKDLHIIERLLKDSGYQVCVLGYCKEEAHNANSDFISIKNPYNKPEMEAGVKWTFFFRLLKWYWNKKHYIEYFLRNVRGSALNYYCGSFLKETDIRFLQQPSDANYFFWGLRSHLLKMRANDWCRPNAAIMKWRKIKLVRRSQNIKFFISNELIRQEFIDCGISPERLVLRPERFIDYDTVGKAVFESPFSFLSIGSIRQEKRIPMAIGAFRTVTDDRCHYDIAGRCNDSRLNGVIEKLSNQDRRISRNDERLSEEEYQGYFERCHFLLLCDVLQQSSVTNGTMMEALLMGKPIIAPAYNPYRYYIDKYHIGLLFDGKSVESLKNAMEKAIKLGAESFQPALLKFGKLFLYKNIQEQFRQELNGINIVPNN